VRGSAQVEHQLVDTAVGELGDPLDHARRTADDVMLLDVAERMSAAPGTRQCRRRGGVRFRR
jgi:hypothetical protein